jgi:peptide/nickel transport system substrate-binding protein
VQVDISPPSTLRQSISTGKVFFRASWIAYPDAENYLSLFYSKNSPDGPNYTHFKMKNSIGYTTKLLRKLMKKRFILYQKMDQIIIDEAPIIPLFYDKVARFTRKEVTGLGLIR